MNEHDYRGRIGIILAASLGIFLLSFSMFAALEAWLDEERGALSENATQILSTAVGGIIGVLAGYVGGIEHGVRKAGESARHLVAGTDRTGTGVSAGGNDPDDGEVIMEKEIIYEEGHDVGSSAGVADTGTSDDDTTGGIGPDGPSSVDKDK